MNRVARTIFGFVIAVVLVTPARRVEADEPAVFQLIPEVQVDSSGIFLNQVVIPHATVPSLRLAPAPPLGQTASLSREQIIALAKAALPALDGTNWTGPTQVKISRRTRLLTEADLVTLLRTVLQRDYVGERGELEIHLARPWDPVTAPDEPLTLQITSIPAAGVMASVVIGFELWQGQERIGSFQTPVQAHIWRQIPVAHAPLLRGQLLEDADIVLERRDVLAERETPVHFPVTDSELELTENVQAGMPVVARMVRGRPLVRRGQLVEALFRDGGLTISLKVESLEDGALGQMVRVRNPRTRRELYGKVQNEDLILITL